MKSRKEIREEAYAKGFAAGFTKGFAEALKKPRAKAGPKTREENFADGFVEGFRETFAIGVAEGSEKYQREYMRRFVEAVERFGYYDENGERVLPMTPEVERFLDGEGDVDGATVRRRRPRRGNGGFWGGKGWVGGGGRG